MAEIATPVELDGQYRALREEAGYVPRVRGALTIRGPDAVEYLQGQLTNDIEGLESERGCYAALLDRKGHLQSDMRVLRLENEEIWLDLEPGPAPAVLKHLRTYSIGREIEIEEVSERWAITSLIGPRAGELSGFDGLGPEHAQRFREWVEIRGRKPQVRMPSPALRIAEFLRQLPNSFGEIFYPRVKRFFHCSIV